MNYSSWNDMLCEHFFKNEEVMVFLSIDKEELINLGLISEKIQREIELIETNKKEQIDHRAYVWADFMRLFMLIMTKKQFLSEFKMRISESATIKDNSKPTIFPFLSLFFISLSVDSDLSSAAFYPKVNDFLITNHIIGHGEKIGTTDLANLNPSLDMMWYNLSEWAFSNGYFFVPKYTRTSDRNKYAEPFIAELLFPFNRREQLKTVFIKSGLTPDENLSEDRIIRIFNDNYYLIGLTRAKMKQWVSDYRIALINEFRKIYGRWDGTARVENRTDASSQVRYDGSNYGFYLGFDQERGGTFKFFLLPYIPNSENSEEYCFVNSVNKNEAYEFYIKANGFASSTYRKTDNILEALLHKKKIVFVDEYDSKTNLIFNPADLYVFERSFNSFISRCKFTKGGSYFIMIATELLPQERFQSWLSDNKANEIPLPALGSSYRMFFIENAQSALEDDSKLSFKKTKSLKISDTIVLGKTENIYLVPSTFPIYFDISGVDISSDSVRAVSIDGSNRYSFDIKYDANSQKWIFPVIQHFFAKDKTYQIFCNDQPLSYSKFRFVDFSLIKDCNYQEISFDKFGNESAENPLVTGLKINDTIYMNVNVELLKLNMKSGEPPVVTNSEYLADDFLLYGISSQPTISKSDIKDLILVLFANNVIDEASVGNKYEINHILEYYSSLGYLNYTYRDGKYVIAVNKPTIIWLPPNFKKTSGHVTSYKCTEQYFKFLVTGARTPGFIKHLIKVCASNNVKVDITQPENPLFPQRIILWAQDISNIERVASQANLAFQRCIYTNALIKRLGSVDDYTEQVRQYPSELVYENISLFRKIDYNRLARLFKEKNGYVQNKDIVITDVDKIDRSHDVITYFFGLPSEATILWDDGIQYPINKYWSHLIGASISNVTIVKFDIDSCTLTMPSQVKLPLLYNRALSLINAEPQDSDGGNNSYKLIVNPLLAQIEPKEILSKLKQL